MSEEEIKVGSLVSYKHLQSRQIRKGKIIVLAKIIDCENEEYTDKTIGYVEYDRCCIPDQIFIEDMTLIKS